MPGSTGTIISFPEGDYTLHALEDSSHATQPHVQAQGEDPCRCSCCKVPLASLEASWEPDYEICHDCFLNKPAARLFWTAEWTSSMTSQAQICEGCECSTDGLRMYQPKVLRCNKCEQSNAKMDSFTAKRFSVDPEFPWEAFRQVSGNMLPNQATCNKADMTDCTHCPARLDLLDNSLYTQQAPFLSAEATNPPLRSNLLHANLQCSQPPSSAVILQASSVLNSAANVICQRSRDFKRHIFRTKQQQLVASPCYDISVAPPQLQPEQLQTLLPCQLQEGQQGQQQVEDAQQDRQTLQALQAQHAQQAQQAQTPPQQQPQQHSHSLPYVRQPQAEAVSTRSLPETISYGELLETDLPKVAQAVVSQSPQDGLASQPAQQLHQLRHQEPLEQVHNTQGQHRHQQDQASVSGSAAKHGTPQDHLKVRTKWGHVAPSTPNSYQQSQVKVRRAASDELHSHSSTPPEHVKDGYIKEQGGKQETQGQKQQQQQHHDPMAAPVRVGRRRSTSDETPIAPKTPTH